MCWKAETLLCWQHITLRGQSYGLPSGHIWCESRTIKKAECQRLDAFDLWFWRRLPKVPCWTARRSILREISPEYSLEGLMLKLKRQYFGHLMWTDDSLEKPLMLGKTEGRRRRECQRMSWLDGTSNAMNMNLGKLWEMLDAVQLSHPLSSPSPPAFSLSQNQGLFQWVSSSHQVFYILTPYQTYHL